ncbi:MAG: peptidoglycan-binding protein [Candidatus Kaiserbacteria bacterium]|nr:MAG: peptidoglycan-binding protein [Candidatus Kaiserbacteria bacterium]
MFSIRACHFAILVSLLAILAVPALTRAESVCPYLWSRDLRLTSVGEDVLKLQQFLNASEETLIASAGVGSPGQESTIFGAKTKAAVAKFQEKYFNEILAPNGLTKGTGTVGPSTRATLNTLCILSPASASSADGTEASVNDALTVSDPGQPDTSLAPSSAGVLFHTFTLAAGSKDVLVSEVVLERTGFGSDGAFANFGLWDEDGLQVGPVAALNSQHRLVFRRSFTIPAGQERTFEVYANMNVDLSSYEGQMPVIQLLSLSASSPVEGQLPLRGTPQTVNNTLTVGGADATLSEYDPHGATTRYIDDTNVRFAGIRIAAHSQESLTFTSIIWTQAGTAGAGDIANVKTVVNGVEYPAIRSPYSEKEYVTLFDPGIVIEKGLSIDVYVKGDPLPGAANRTIKFDIRDINDEVGLDGNLYGFGVGLSPVGNTDVAGAESAFITSDGTTDGDTGSPFFSGSTITIRGATATGVGKM